MAFVLILASESLRNIQWKALGQRLLRSAAPQPVPVQEGVR